MENLQENKKIEIEQDTLNDLNTTRKWSMFMAILGFIFLGLLLIVGLLAGTFFSAMSPGTEGLKIGGVFFFIIFLIIAAIYFFPVLFLFRFSRHTGNAVASLDKAELHKAFRNLKSYFVYIGVLIIIVLSLYLISLIFIGSSLSFLKGLS